MLHDAVPSAIRSGVASGVGSLSWLVFLPVALGFGALSTAHGVQRAGWVLVALALLAGTLLAVTARSARSAVGGVGGVGGVGRRVRGRAGAGLSDPSARASGARRPRRRPAGSAG